MSYRIGSFNYLNFGMGNNKDLQIFKDIIINESLDVIALQEIKSLNVVEKILKYLPANWTGCHDSYANYSSPNEYAFIWNTRRLRECSKLEYPEIFKHVKSDDLIRKPYYGRFTPAGLPGGAFFELRLIDVHIFHGSTMAKDMLRRKEEYVTLANEVYTRINMKRYGNNMPSYTIMLGDYNLTVDWCEKQNLENQSIQTFQNELTTLKNSEAGFKSSYDHFTYDQKRFSTINASVSRINSVEKYCDSDYERHRKDVSDHVPIMIEINLK